MRAPAPHVILSVQTERVLPFHILHQTVIVTSGFLIRNWDLPIIAKYRRFGEPSLLASLAVIMGLCEFAIRRVNVLRILFGLKAKPQSTAAQSPEATPPAAQPEAPPSAGR